jgi:hypothetical protein
MSNLGVTISTEGFAGGAPWYADNGPYYNGEPGHVELGLSEDEQYYRNVVGALPYYEMENSHIKATAAAAESRLKDGRKSGTAPNGVSLAPTRLSSVPSDDKSTVDKTMTALNANSGQVVQSAERLARSSAIKQSNSPTSCGSASKRGSLRQ